MDVIRHRSIVSGRCCLSILLVAWFCGTRAWSDNIGQMLPDSDAVFDRFADHCFQCHGFGESEGGFSFEALADGEYGTKSLQRWEAVWKNLRSETMPPPSQLDRPTPKQRAGLLDWINRQAFHLKPDRVDPGKVVLRRLNRSEYQATVQKLTGVRINARDWLPPDDTGFGFDTVGETLTLSPVVLERYIALSQAIVREIFPPPTATSPKRSGDSGYGKLASAILLGGPPPEDAPRHQRSEHVGAVLKRFADRAFRRPIDQATLGKLTDHAMFVSSQPGKQYQDGIAAAIGLILISPRFLYRTEHPDPHSDTWPVDDRFVAARIDNYALASRLSYFLWGTMPDARLLQLAADGVLHQNLHAEVDRMIDTQPDFARGIENFVGQWLNIRDVTLAQVHGKTILRKRRSAEVRSIFNDGLRRAMQRETYLFVEELIRNDRPLHELLNANYTYVNKSLAKFYGIRTQGKLSEGRHDRVQLPPDANRRGVLTHASVLLVTSNPTRTSPVKRGLFVLENLLGVPGPPPPPDIPQLDEAVAGKTHPGTLRELLEKHRQDAACASCHQRMDPIGLALENFNAIGQYVDATYPPRDDWKNHPDDQPQPVDASGVLMTGETFNGHTELLDILANQRRGDLYRCVAEKWLTFAIGRGLTYRDIPTIDKMVARLDQDNGSSRQLIHSIAGSLPFTHVRVPIDSIEAWPPSPKTEY